MSDDAPRDRAVTEEAARTGEFPNATGDPTDDSNPVAGGGAADDDARVGGENEARNPDPPESYPIETGRAARPRARGARSPEEPPFRSTPY